MEFGGFDAAEAENDADTVGFFLLTEEDDDAVRVDVLAEVH